MGTVLAMLADLRFVAVNALKRYLDGDFDLVARKTKLIL